MTTRELIDSLEADNARLRCELAGLRSQLDTANRAILDAEHRLRLLAERTDDYGPEGMRTRLIAEFQKLAGAVGAVQDDPE